LSKINKRYDLVGNHNSQHTLKMAFRSLYNIYGVLERSYGHSILFGHCKEVVMGWRCSMVEGDEKFLHFSLNV
jgi:hypothetical protein